MPSAAPRQRLRLLSFNCLGVPLLPATGARLATLGRALDGAGHDVICLQEIQFSGYLPLLRRSFAGFPHRVYLPFLHAPKGGLVTLSRWPVGRVEFIPYRARGPWWYTPAVSDWLLYKGVLVAHLTAPGMPVIVVNTHLLANYSGDWSRGNLFARHQHAQLAQLAAIVNALDRRAAVVVAGDFNVPRGSWLYDGFVAATGLLDLMAGCDRPTYRQSFLMPGRYAQAIDFVFVRASAAQRPETAARLVFEEKIKLVSGRIDYLSDHLGIEAEIAWDGPGGAPPAA
jgi:endonuclease/exonuclease/phosphatase family metal-dependent hydrolase